MRRKTTKKTAYIFALVVLSLMTIQSIQITKAQNTTNNQWALSFSVENTQNVTCTTFAPFDQVRLSSTVTYGNASVPDLLVTFKVQGPLGSANPTNITAIAETNAAGIADSTFRLPTEAENAGSVVGTWQATATIRTSNSTLQKSLSFTSQWNLEITSVSIENQLGHNQTIFYQGNTVTVGLSVDNAGDPQQANITLNMCDASGKVVNQTQIENTQIDGNSTPTQLQTTLEIPADAVGGEASITAAIYSGTYQNTGVPAGENQTAYFTIVGSGGTGPSPSPTPTKTPNILQNSVSLFSWLLVATGLFTFTALYMFLRRKPTEIAIPMPSIPPTTLNPNLPNQPFNQATTAQENPQPPPSTSVPIAGTAQERTMQATVETQTVAFPTLQMQNTEQTQKIEEAQEENIPTIEAVLTPSEELSLFKEPAPEPMKTKVGRIQNTAKRIQAIKAALELEKEQTAQDLAELNKSIDERETLLKKYVEVARGEAGKLQNWLDGKGENAAGKQDGNNKSVQSAIDMESILSKEIKLQAMSTQLNRISSLKKRIEALKLALKLENEQLGEDFSELRKAVEEQEKAVKNQFDKIKEEIENLQKNLTDTEN